MSTRRTAECESSSEAVLRRCSTIHLRPSLWMRRALHTCDAVSHACPPSRHSGAHKSRSPQATQSALYRMTWANHPIWLSIGLAISKHQFGTLQCRSADVVPTGTIESSVIAEVSSDKFRAQRSDQSQRVIRPNTVSNVSLKIFGGGRVPYHYLELAAHEVDCQISVAVIRGYEVCRARFTRWVAVRLNAAKTSK